MNNVSMVKGSVGLRGYKIIPEGVFIKPLYKNILGLTLLLLASIMSMEARSAVFSAPETSSNGQIALSFHSNTYYFVYIQEVLPSGSVTNLRSFSGTPPSGSMTVSKSGGTYNFRLRRCRRITGGNPGQCIVSATQSVVVGNQTSIPSVPAPSLAQPTAPNTGFDSMETIPGTFSVSASGQATYEIPIVTAPSGGNFKPELSLTYSSSAGNGMVGYGWGIGGLGSITRCRQTQAQDQAVAPISWNSNDRFCLNGQRLLVTNGSYGAPGSMYRTESDRFLRVTAVGGSAGTPSHFKVEHKSGIVEYFGSNSLGTGGSTNALHRLVKGSNLRTYSWLISRQEDSAGNHNIYSYYNTGSGAQPRIRYIDYAHANGGPHAEILFDWEVRQDKTRGYVGGYLYNNEHRLSEITSYHGGSQIRRYQLNYDDDAASPTDRVSRLESISHCVNSICGRASVFEWELPLSLGLNPQASTGFEMDFGVENYTLGDITGNGLQDLIWVGSGQVHQAIASLDSRKNIQYTKRSIANGPIYTLPNAVPRMIDYDGDGRQDLVISAPSGGTGVRIYRSRPQSDGTWSIVGGNGLTPDISVSGGHPLFVDVTGNGLQDMIGLRTLRARLHMSSDYGVYHAPKDIEFSHPAGLSTCTPTVLQLHPTTGDFNGNGRIDFIGGTRICTSSGEVTRYFLYTSEQTASQTASGTLGLRYYAALDNQVAVAYSEGATLSLKVAAVDLNNDGISDLVYDPEIVGGNGAFRFRLNRGDGLEPIRSIPYMGPWNLTSFVDVNNDGHPDIVTVILQQGITNNFVRSRRWDPAINNFLSSYRSIPLPVEAAGLPESIKFSDVNGNGFPDLIAADTYNYNGNNNFVVVPHFGGSLQHSENYQIPNKIKEIHDGNEVTYINYESLGQSNHYSYIRGIGSSNQSVCQSTSAGNSCWTREVAVSTWHVLQSRMQNPFSGMSSGNARIEDPFLHRVFNTTGSMPVVTQVSRRRSEANNSTPQSVNTNILRATKSYYYEHGRMQASGRGFLGFKRVTEVDRLNGNRKVSDYRQDWPFTGSPLNVTHYNRQGRKLKETRNEWSLAGCTSPSCISGRRHQVINGGTASAGALSPFLARSEAIEYNLQSTQGPVISRQVMTRSMNGHGNITEEVEDVYGPGNTWLKTRTTSNTYQTYSGTTYSMSRGRLTRRDVTHSNPEGTANRAYEYTYHTSGAATGLVETEVIEPDQPEFRSTTTHYYDDFGNRVQSNTTADGVTRYGPRLEYDYAGRYPTHIFGYRTGGSETSQVEYLQTRFMNHDQYGTPTNIRHYVSATQYTTELAATTPFGTPYFRSTSTGERTTITSGVSHAQCPSSMATRRYVLISELGGVQSLTCYDRHKRVVREGQVMFDGRWSLTDIEYDRLGRVLRRSAPYFSGSNSIHWTRYQYDVLDRVTRIHHPDTTSPTQISYNSHTKTTTNPLGNSQEETTSPLGQLVETKGALTGTNISYTYDPQGNMTAMTGPGGTTSITYDLLGRKLGMNDPDKGVWSYQYNGFGEITCQTDARGHRIVNRYDRRGRLYNRRDATGGSCSSPSGIQSNTTWTYDTAGYGFGKLNRVVDSTTGYERQYYYDHFGRHRQTRTRLPGVNNQLQNHYERTTYDQYGRVFQVFDAARSGTDFTDNGVQHLYRNGYIERLVDAVHVNGHTSTTYYRAQHMDARGNVTRAIFGNGVTRNATYNAANGRTSRLNANVPGLGLIQDLNVTWDDAGNLLTRDEFGRGSGFSPRSLEEAFSYDAMNRLRSWTSAGEFNGVENYNYNARDNLTSKTGVGSYTYGNAAKSGSCNGGPHAVCTAGGVAYQYDNNGNMTGGDGRTVSYSVFNKATSLSKGGHTTTIAYGPDRQRYKRVDVGSNGTTTTLYIGGVEKVHYPDNTVQWRRQVGGVAIVNERRNSQGSLLERKTQYAIKDHLGSTVLLTESSGYVSQEFYYDPWGQPRKPQYTGGSFKPVLDQPFRLIYKPDTTRGYTDHEHLDEVGIIHMNGRIYDPRLARFMQADPIVQDPRTTRSLNRYSYVWNNPLNATDPSGFTTESAHEAERAKTERQRTIERWANAGLQQASFFAGTGRFDISLNGVSSSSFASAAAFDSMMEFSMAFEETFQVETTSFGVMLDGTPGSVTSSKFVTVRYSMPSNRSASAQEGIRIDIGYTDAVGHGLHGQHHALVIITDPATGQQYAVRAGPSGGLGPSQSAGNSAASGSGGSVSATAGNGGSGGHGLGSIYAEHGIYNETFRDAPGAVHRIQHVGYLNSSFDNVRAMAVDFSNVTNANRLPYRPLTLNSNSFAFTFVESLGFSRPTPVIGAPGWQNGAVSSSLSYP